LGKKSYNLQKGIKMETALQQSAKRLSISVDEFQRVVVKTIFPANARVSNEQFTAFIAVANKLKLDPVSKEIYAFPAKGGGIQAMVSIDGWIKLMNADKDFDGMEQVDNFSSSNCLESVTTRIYKKNLSKAITHTEYMSECKKNSPPWQSHPRRMLGWRSLIQTIRIATGISGVIDEDDVSVYREQGIIVDGDSGDNVVEFEKKQLPAYSDNDFNDNFVKWQNIVESGKKSAEEIIAMLSTKFTLSEKQIDAINDIGLVSGELMDMETGEVIQGD
jgi:phage recombination protein Bet